MTEPTTELIPQHIKRLSIRNLLFRIVGGKIVRHRNENKRPFYELDPPLHSMAVYVWMLTACTAVYPSGARLVRAAAASSFFIICN
jgi:hypothetical protein